MAKFEKVGKMIDHPDKVELGDVSLDYDTKIIYINKCITLKALYSYVKEQHIKVDTTMLHSFPIIALSPWQIICQDGWKIDPNSLQYIHAGIVDGVGYGETSWAEEARRGL